MRMIFNCFDDANPEYDTPISLSSAAPQLYLASMTVRRRGSPVTRGLTTLVATALLLSLRLPAPCTGAGGHRDHSADTPGEHGGARHAPAAPRLDAIGSGHCHAAVPAPCAMTSCVPCSAALRDVADLAVVLPPRVVALDALPALHSFSVPPQPRPPQA
jgi:hypothetical protein